MPNPYDHYRKVATQTADPVELVVMLYRGAITNLSCAEQSLNSGERDLAHLRLVRAQEIIAELMGTLNLDSGEIARNLHQLYDYMQRRLIAANLRKDGAPVAEVRELLLELLEAWQQAGERSRAAGAGPLGTGAAVAVA